MAIITFVTFGQAHSHTLTGGVVLDKDCIASFTTDSVVDAGTVITELFGTQYSMAHSTSRPGEQNAESIHPAFNLNDYPRGVVQVPQADVDTALAPVGP